jgi:AcrR family transcriptional regulator
MSRTKLVSDSSLLLDIWVLLRQAKLDAPSFRTIAAAVGHSAPTLVQRFGSREAMLERAILAAWDRLDDATDAAIGESLNSGKGAQALLKNLSAAEDTCRLLSVSQAYGATHDRAKAWRAMVEAALAKRLGGSGLQARETGARLFALWQGRMSWQETGGKNFRLGEAIKELSR